MKKSAPLSKLCDVPPPEFNSAFNFNFGVKSLTEGERKTHHLITPEISYPKPILLLYPPVIMKIAETDIAMNIINVEGGQYNVSPSDHFPLILLASGPGIKVIHLDEVSSIGEHAPEYH